MSALLQHQLCGSAPRSSPAKSGGGGGAGGTLAPFLQPDMAAVFRKLPARSAPADYLATVAHNVLAEYRLFLQESSFTRYVLELRPSEESTAAAGGDIFVRKATKLQPHGAGGDSGGAAVEALQREELRELHHHVGVMGGRLVIAAFNGETERLRMVQGAAWEGRRLASAAEDEWYDLGYMGDAVNELAAAAELMLRSRGLSGRDGLTQAPPRLLASVADPSARRLAAFCAAGVRPGGVVPINTLQRSVLDAMRYDVEAVQGAHPARDGSPVAGFREHVGAAPALLR
jgi:hypothetical protein